MPGGPGRFARSSTSSVLLWSASQRLLSDLPRTGLSPALADLSRSFRWPVFSSKHPQPRGEPRFGLFRFRSPLLTESMSLSVPAGNEMFQFPAFALLTLCVQVRVTRSLGLGFPIRTSPDQRLFADSPGLIAGCRVLRRLSMPRHPPCTLSSLTTFIDHRRDPLTEELTPSGPPAGGRSPRPTSSTSPGSAATSTRSTSTTSSRSRPRSAGRSRTGSASSRSPAGWAS